MDFCVFASGTGSNFRKICEFFQKNQTQTVTLLVCNNRKAGAIQAARDYGIPCHLITPEDLKKEALVGLLKDEYDVRWVALAGFLRLLPPALIRAFGGRIINLHPALLSAKNGKYGGKGMHGMRVHRRVLADGEKRSGISIHYVNEQYDRGSVFREYTCAVRETDTPETLCERVQQLSLQILSKSNRASHASGCVSRSPNSPLIVSAGEKKIGTALLSLSNKAAFLPLAKCLHALGITLYATRGTADCLGEHKIPTHNVETLTGYPTLLGGRVKTLHPKIFGGILHRRDKEEDRREVIAHALPTIDLVVVDPISLCLLGEGVTASRGYD